MNVEYTYDRKRKPTYYEASETDVPEKGLKKYPSGIENLKNQLNKEIKGLSKRVAGLFSRKGNFR